MLAEDDGIMSKPRFFKHWNVMVASQKEHLPCSLCHLFLSLIGQLFYPKVTDETELHRDSFLHPPHWAAVIWCVPRLCVIRSVRSLLILRAALWLKSLDTCRDSKRRRGRPPRGTGQIIVELCGSWQMFHLMSFSRRLDLTLSFPNTYIRNVGYTKAFSITCKSLCHVFTYFDLCHFG